MTAAVYEKEEGYNDGDLQNKIAYRRQRTTLDVYKKSYIFAPVTRPIVFHSLSDLTSHICQ